MDIQWSLVLFTALTGAGGWLFACTAADEFLKKFPKAAFNTALTALILLAVGGVASVTHLSHPDRMLNALQHPTSGIFVEAVLVGCAAVCVIIYLVLVKRDASAGARKAFAILGAVFGVLLSFMAGESYMMSARPNWNTILLPLGYLGTAIPAGVAAYLCVAAATQKEKLAEGAKSYGTALAVGGAVAAVLGAAYVIYAGVSTTTVAVLLVVCLAGSGVVPIVGGLAVRKKPESLLGTAVVSLVCALAGAVAYRCIMWLITVAIADLFGVAI